MENSMDVLAVLLFTLAALLLCVKTSVVLLDSNECNRGIRNTETQKRTENFPRITGNKLEADFDKWFQPNTEGDEDCNTLLRNGVEEHKSDICSGEIIPTAKTPPLDVLQSELGHSAGTRVDCSHIRPGVSFGPHIGRNLPEPGTWFGPRIGRSNPAPGTWFGPRIGRSYSEPGTWFGPRVGRSHPGKWFGPRVGRSYPESQMWFGPRVGHSYSDPAMWVGPRVGHVHFETELEM
ncbi:uncharacterized protein LOC126267638 [Schistocerca gregaria]|uniref:uncharacterized protein LOC126267638 n=1 Tax=Schistocerca gregaria TaxID=7010 RepID=UPI00211E3349|nr:uncharacterized protein LOC126267638 [Schistocerca gregaria]